MNSPFPRSGTADVTFDQDLLFSGAFRCFVPFVAVSVSLLLIVCGSVMTSHMEREVCALTNELAELNEVARELEGELALKNDPLKMEQLATELGMVRAEYVQTRVLQNTAEEYTVVYNEGETQTAVLATLLSAIGFFKD